MTLAEAVCALVHGHAHGVPTFDALLVEVQFIMRRDVSATELDAAARPYEVGRPGAYRYEREDGPGHCPCQSVGCKNCDGEHIASCEDIPFGAGATGGE